MGRGVKFKVRLPNGQYHNVLGPFTGEMTPDGRGYVKVENDPYLPDGEYPVSSDNAQQYIALLTEEELKKQGIELGKDVDGNAVSSREDSVIPNLADLVKEVKPTQPEVKKILVSDLPDDTTDFDAQDFMLESDFDQIKFEVSKTPDAEESYALYQYQGPKYEDLNKFARINPNYTKDSKNDFLAERFPEEASIINKIDNVFANSKIAEDRTVFRGASISPDRYKELLNLKIGDEFTDSAYLSTSADPLIAKSFAYNGFTDDASRIPIIYKINVKAGQPAIRIKDYTTDDILKESEILLARGSTIKVTNLLKTTFDPLTEDGESRDVLIIEGDYTPAQAEPEPETAPITQKNIKELYDNPLNEPTGPREEKLTKDLYNLMLASGLTPEDIASVDRTYENFKATYEDQKVPLKDQEEVALEVVSKLSREWNASTSYDSIKKLQNIAEKVFNPEGTYKKPISDPEWLEELKNTKSRQVSESLLKAMYDNTQKYFADNKIKSLVVYRGLSGSIDALEDLQEGEIGDIGALQGAPMASWTLDPREAGYFAGRGVILRSEIPVSSVLSLPFTGLFGVHAEQELVVLGMPRNTKAVKYDRDLGSADEILKNLRALDFNFDASKHLGLVPATEPSAGDTDMPGVIDVVSEEATKKRLNSY
jgi:hypothetical protein